MLEIKYVLSILWRCFASMKLTINFFWIKNQGRMHYLGLVREFQWPQIIASGDWAKGAQALTFKIIFFNTMIDLFP